VQLASLQNDSPSVFSFYSKKPNGELPHEGRSCQEKKGKVIVLGGSAVDFEVKVTDGKF
jgi:hypothetical protein